MGPAFVCALLSALMFAGNVDNAAAAVRLVPIDSQDHTIVAGQQQPLAKFATVYADNSGATHIKQCRFEGLSFQTFPPLTQPVWVDWLPYEVTSLTFVILPEGFAGQWQTAHGPQFVICLSGAFSLETTNGQVLTQYAGDWHFEDDTGSKPRPDDFRVGHLPRTVGNEPCSILLVHVKNRPKVVCE